MKKLKILIVTSFYPPYHVGGACTHSYYLANGLAKHGHDVHVLYNKDAYYLKRNGSPKRKDYPNHKNITLHEITTPLGKWGVLGTYITSAIPYPSFVEKVMDDGYDLIHYHNISLFGPRIFLMGNAPKIFTAHDHWLICPFNDFFTGGKICDRGPSNMTCAKCLVENRRPVQLWRFSSLMERGLKEISLIISPSEYLKGFLHDYGIRIPIKVIPNFVSAHPKKGERLDPAQKKPYFFFAGMMEEAKGIMSLLEAFKGTRKRLILAGTGSLEPKVRRFIKKNHMENQIHHPGFIRGKRIHSYFRNAEAFILPSSSPENAPLTILEAMSMGTPSIGTHAGGIPEMIGRIDQNLIVNVDDPVDLRRVIKGFDKKRYDPKKIRAVFERHYTVERFLGSFENAIRTLIQE